MPHYVTLGYASNPILEKYQARFLTKLAQLWEKEVGSMLPSEAFFLVPDYHGALFDISRDPDTQSSDTLRQWLMDEYALYSQGKICHGIRPREEGIPGTTIALTTTFYNPCVDAGHVHPDHRAHQIHSGYGSKSIKAWQALFAQTFEILSGTSPEFLTEVSMLIRKVIPYDVSYQVHNSASYSTFIGHLLMSYPTGMDHGALALLEAIIHEYNHNKLNLILHSEVLLTNDRSERYYSPYRPDARHLHGIYLGLHALTGAYWAILHAHLRGVLVLPENWIDKAVLYILKNGLSIQVLEKYAHFTPIGSEIFLEMCAVHGECLAAVKNLELSRDRMTTLRAQLQEHYLEVRRTNVVLFS